MRGILPVTVLLKNMSDYYEPTCLFIVDYNNPNQYFNMNELGVMAHPQITGNPENDV